MTERKGKAALGSEREVQKEKGEDLKVGRERADETGAERGQRRHLQHLPGPRKRRGLKAVRHQEVHEVQEVIAKKKRGAGPDQRWKERGKIEKG